MDHITASEVTFSFLCPNKKVVYAADVKEHQLGFDQQAPDIDPGKYNAYIHAECPCGKQHKIYFF